MGDLSIRDDQSDDEAWIRAALWGHEAKKPTGEQGGEPTVRHTPWGDMPPPESLDQAPIRACGEFEAIPPPPKAIVSPPQRRLRTEEPPDPRVVPLEHRVLGDVVGRPRPGTEEARDVERWVFGGRR